MDPSSGEEKGKQKARKNSPSFTEAETDALVCHVYDMFKESGAEELKLTEVDWNSVKDKLNGVFRNNRDATNVLLRFKTLKSIFNRYKELRCRGDGWTWDPVNSKIVAPSEECWDALIESHKEKWRPLRNKRFPWYDMMEEMVGGSVVTLDQTSFDQGSNMERSDSSDISDNNMEKTGDTGTGAGASLARGKRSSQLKRKRSPEPVPQLRTAGTDNAASPGPTLASAPASIHAPEKPQLVYLDPCISELQRIEEELDRRHSSRKMQLQKQMEEEVRRIRRGFEEKVKEEEGKHQQVKMQLVDTRQNLLQHKRMVEELLDKFIQPTGLSASASSSSQVLEYIPQLWPQPPLPQPIWRAVPAPASAPAPAPASPPAPTTPSTPIPPPTALATAMGSAQTGDQSGSHPCTQCCSLGRSSRSSSPVETHIASTTPHRPSTAPSASTAVLALGAAHLAPEPYQQPDLSAHLPISTPASVSSISSQGFAPSSGTPLCHPNQALGAALSALAPYLAFSGPHPSAIPHMSTPSPVASASSQWIGSPTGASLWQFGLAPGTVLSAPESNLPSSRPHPSAIPDTSTPVPVASSSSQWIGSSGGTLWHFGQAPRAPESNLPSSRPHPSVIAATSTPGPTPLVSSAAWRPSSGGFLPHPTPAPGAVLRARAPHLACARPYPSVNPGTFPPVPPGYGPAIKEVGPAAHAQSQVQDRGLGGSCVSSGLRSTVPNNGNTKYNTADNSTSSNGNGTSGGNSDGTGSGGERVTVNVDVKVCLSDEEQDMDTSPFLD